MIYYIGAIFSFNLYRNQDAHLFSLSKILKFVTIHYICVKSPKNILIKKTNTIETNFLSRLI